MTRIAVVHKPSCNPSKCGDLCIKLCPVNRTGKECISKDEDGKARIDETLCTGCGICSNRCPFRALSIIKLPEALKQSPIHRYGENGFQLFNLPVPLFGKLTGLIGKNGIGKSTALKVLSGLFRPNLGNPGKEATEAELIEHFKGSEAQVFFEKKSTSEMRVSYKPQQVDALPKAKQGTVRELLQSADEKGKKKDYAEQLSLNHCLDTDISQVSGGELQRVAIAAAALKDASVYFFDEPTSYLDIKQRIAVSRFLRSLLDEQTSVMVVEHDLIILDYMADLIHLLYGEPSCYGIVSQPKATKAGINTYLSGYLKEENIRFREKPIVFYEKQPFTKEDQETLVSWEDFSKQLGDFTVHAPAGRLTRKEVAGVLGPNGIGKTSFVKMLADRLAPDNGRINQRVSVSYKPQYLESDTDQLVRVVLDTALNKYEHLLVRHLGLRPLLEKQVNELSGGEMQRVAIAATLSEEADLYLLDEPSAYLDVEQRLSVSRAIAGFMEEKGKTALIVDHDLLFLDYISNSLMVFEGSPGREGKAQGPYTMVQGMNMFLHELDMTLRRDAENNRPRVNKPESQMDQKQKKEGKWYYS